MEYTRINNQPKGNTSGAHFDKIRAKTRAGEEARRLGFVADVGPLELTPPAPLEQEGDAEHFAELRAKKIAERETKVATENTRRERFLRHGADNASGG